MAGDDQAQQGDSRPGRVGAALCFVRGAPGIGKSTVGRLLIGQLTNGALVEVDQFRAMLARCDWHDRNQHEVGMRVATQAARGFLNSGATPVIIVDTFGRDHLPRMQAAFGDFVQHATVSLWVEPAVLQARLSQRGCGYQDLEQAKWINEEIAAVRFSQESLLDTTLMGPEAVADALVELFAIGCGPGAARGARAEVPGP